MFSKLLLGICAILISAGSSILGGIYGWGLQVHNIWVLLGLQIFGQIFAGLLMTAMKE